MRMIQATQFTGYQGLVQLDAPKPQVADGRVLVRVTAAGFPTVTTGPVDVTPAMAWSGLK